jgi:hypothetical protein
MFRSLSLLLDDPAMPVHFSHDLGRSDAVRVAKFANNRGIYSRIACQGGKQPPPHLGIGPMRSHNRPPVLLWQCSCARHRSLADVPLFVKAGGVFFIKLICCVNYLTQ